MALKVRHKSAKVLVGERSTVMSIGIASGNCFCSVIGTERRSEYAVFGQPMILAARLMQGDNASRILCDGVTQQGAERTFEFENLGTRKLKGFEREVAVFCPTGKVDRWINNDGDRIPFFGRENEISVGLIGGSRAVHGLVKERMLSAVLTITKTHQNKFAIQTIRKLHERGKPFLYCVSGSPGSGKSALLEELMYVVGSTVTRTADEFRSFSGENTPGMTSSRRRRRRKSSEIYIGCAQSGEEQTPFFAWRSIIAALIDLEVSFMLSFSLFNHTDVYPNV